MYFALFQIPYPDDPGRAVGITAGFFLVQGLYFIVVVAVVTRIRSRKPRALLVAAVAVVLDTLFTWLTGILLVVVIQVLMSFVYAPVWGIARRQHRKWMIGLALGVVIVAVYVPFVFGLTVDGQVWLWLWAINVGTFAVVCLVCWAFDVAGRRRDLKSPVTP